MGLGGRGGEGNLVRQLQVIRNLHPSLRLPLVATRMHSNSPQADQGPEIGFRIFKIKIEKKKKMMFLNREPKIDGQLLNASWVVLAVPCRSHCSTQRIRNKKEAPRRNELELRETDTRQRLQMEVSVIPVSPSPALPACPSQTLCLSPPPMCTRRLYPSTSTV